MTDPTITLRPRRWALKGLREHKTSGGFQNYQRRLLAKIPDRLADEIEVVFTEQELGELVRMMGYGSGGFQGALRKAFTSALLRHIGYD